MNGAEMKFVSAKVLRDMSQAEAEALLRAAGACTNLAALAELLQRCPPTPGAVALLILRVREHERSAVAARAARGKNEELRAWVVTQWKKRNDRGQSKASFVRDLRVRESRRLANITDKRVAEHWLKGH